MLNRFSANSPDYLDARTNVSAGADVDTVMVAAKTPKVVEKRMPVRANVKVLIMVLILTLAYYRLSLRMLCKLNQTELRPV